jgi:hypothetical protein
MTIWHSAFVTLFFFFTLGTCYWVGQAIYWLWDLYTRDEALPPPEPDNRDDRWKRIVDEDMS